MSRHKGNLAEEKAAVFLRKKGFEILGRNFYTRFGEIDIIALKHNILHFVEVKSGKDFEPIYNLTPTKIERIVRSVALYLACHNENRAYCIDALLVREEGCELVENITV